MQPPSEDLPVQPGPAIPEQPPTGQPDQPPTGQPDPINTGVERPDTTDDGTGRARTGTAGTQKARKKRAGAGKADTGKADAGKADAEKADAAKAELPPVPLRKSPALRIHMQGTFLLIMLLLALWGAMTWAGDVIGDALDGPDGAIVAEAREEVEEPVEGFAVDDPDAPLQGEEVAELQAVLDRFGYAPGPVDGILGDLTRAAAEQAKADLSLTEESDRVLYETLLAALDALENAASDPSTP